MELMDGPNPMNWILEDSRPDHGFTTFMRTPFTAYPLTHKMCSSCMGKGSIYKDIFTDKPCKKCDGSGLESGN